MQESYVFLNKETIHIVLSRVYILERISTVELQANFVLQYKFPGNKLY